MNETEKFWTERYIHLNTGWDVGQITTPIKEYIDQLQNKDIRILIPGAGNGHEAEYLFKQGFTNIFILDISSEPLSNFSKRLPSFPKDHLIQDDFFEHQGEYDLIIEQTFFCSFPPLPPTRIKYAEKMSSLLTPEGKLIGLWFDFPLTDDLIKRPFGGSKSEYTDYFSPFFHIDILERCHNSIDPRMGKELFGILRKRG